MKYKKNIILIVSFVLFICIINVIYKNIIKNKAEEIINKIDRITFANYTLDKENIKNNLKYHKGWDITKGEYTGTIYYLNGNAETIKLYRNSGTSYLVKIQNMNFVLSVYDN